MFWAVTYLRRRSIVAPVVSHSGQSPATRQFRWRTVVNWRNLELGIPNFASLIAPDVRAAPKTGEPICTSASRFCVVSDRTTWAAPSQTATARRWGMLGMLGVVAADLLFGRRHAVKR
jgi:hypothetical protein